MVPYVALITKQIYRLDLCHSHDRVLGLQSKISLLIVHDNLKDRKYVMSQRHLYIPPTENSVNKRQEIQSIDP
jgi:hypothetical protein